MSAFDAHERAFLELLRNRDDKFLSGTWTLRNGPKGMMSMPRGEGARGRC